MKQITTEEFKKSIFDFNKLTNINDITFKDNKSAIIDFYADWCNPCKALHNILEKVKDSNENINFYKVDVENDIELSELFKIRNIPFLVLINKEGKIKTLSGLKTKDEIQNNINTFLN